ncbi:MAG: ParB family transcriptional regulator, chromosome partitioning protein [Solirubrobacteraceae bacterium]|jgi:ParB/RepB/Spo0J family partition protein|nr:ParB family transcriptional regulator, chromosome partitioning protein [Solirubrobacteraceae bacterium]MEA2290842.1 ParB family transcriptional regulator, chromosome partitioning protein [Solirubrobacteraceae bacterium]
MSQVDKLQDAEEEVAQMREEATRAEREAREAELRRAPLADTATRPHALVTAALSQVRTMANMRVGALPDIHELAVSIKETGLLHPPLVRATGDAGKPYELLAGRRRFAAMKLLDETDGERADWRFTVVEGISRREALTMQFAENFHQRKPEPVQFARAARAIMGEDRSLTAADVSRLVGAPTAWTRKALRLLDLPEAIVERVEKGDLSFTVADIVRRGIARGDVSAEAASDLVDKHADGEITGGALKLGVGYVPPKPKNYDELSRKLDEARWAASRGEGADEGVDAEQRDWESGGSDRGAAGERGRGSVSAAPAAPARRREPAPDVPAEDLDAYVVGLVLARVAPAEYRRALDITDEESAHGYAFSLRPGERLSVLRTLAAELVAADPKPPRALRGRLAA